MDWKSNENMFSSTIPNDFHTLVANVWQSLNWYGIKSQNRQSELSYEMKVRVPSEYKILQSGGGTEQGEHAELRPWGSR